MDVAAGIAGAHSSQPHILAWQRPFPGFKVSFDLLESVCLGEPCFSCFLIGYVAALALVLELSGDQEYMLLVFGDFTGLLRNMLVVRGLGPHCLEITCLCPIFTFPGRLKWQCPSSCCVEEGIE